MKAVGRRGLLGYAAAAAAGGAVGAGGTALLTPASTATSRLVTPHGPHQVALELSPPAVTEIQALTVRPELDRDGLGRLLRSWTAGIEALTAGRGALGDPAPWLADAAAGLTVTVGVGLALVGTVLPTLAGLSEVPAMSHDALLPEWGGGDLVLVIGARDGTTAAHAVRRLVADAAPFATARWRQSGTWNTLAADGTPITGRNLFGQVDGSANPAPGTALFDSTVWVPDGPWAGGTTLVVRRIRMDLDRWESLTRAEMEAVVGRRLADGAPLSGGRESDDLDLTSFRDGLPVIPAGAHARVSHPSVNDGRRIVRRGANYVFGAESGLIFQSHQASVADQFVPVQQALDAEDALNEWTTAIGSAVFAILPGFTPGSWLGESLLT